VDKNWLLEVGFLLIDTGPIGPDRADRFSPILIDGNGEIQTNPKLLRLMPFPKPFLIWTLASQLRGSNGYPAGFSWLDSPVVNLDRLGGPVWEVE